MNLKASIVRGLNRHVLPRWRLTLKKSANEADALPAPGPMRDRLVGNAAALLQPWADGIAIGADAKALIEEFIAVFARRPVRDNAGGSGFNGSLCLFAAVRLLEPDLIVESGTWKGHSAWLFRQAAPRARIVTFDIEHENLEHREPGVDYRLGDWMGHEIAAEGNALAFFDDHVSHARRIREAHARGFRQLLADDDLPAEALFVTGLPPAPTAAMLADPAVQAGQVFAWRYRGRDFSLTVTEDDIAARSLIAGRHAAPDLAPATYHPRHNGVTVLRLKS